MSGVFQCGVDARNDQASNVARIPKPDLAFRGVDIDVDVLWQALDEQGDNGIASRGDEIGVGGFDGAEQDLVTHGAAIDE